MNRPLAVFVLALLAWPGHSVVVNATERPNVILILADDLGEKNDLAARMPERVEQLHGKLQAWRREVDAKMPPQVEPKRPATETTKSFDGVDLLFDVELNRHRLGYELAAGEEGFALHKSPVPLAGRVTLRTTITPLQAHPTNGLLVFGNSDRPADLVKCGFFVSGRSAAIYEGVYPSDDLAKVALVSQAGVPLEVVVVFDSRSGTVQMTLAGKTVTKKLTRQFEAITHYGYGVVRTRSAFSAIAVEVEQ